VGQLHQATVEFRVLVEPRQTYSKAVKRIIGIFLEATNGPCNLLKRSPRCKRTTELNWKLSFRLVQQTGTSQRYHRIRRWATARRGVVSLKTGAVLQPQTKLSSRVVRNVAIAALLLHFAVIHSVVALPDVPRPYEGDSYSRYWKIANEINSGRGFSRDGLHPDTDEQPLYPLFMATAYRFPHPRVVLVGTQCILGLLVALLTFRTATLLSMRQEVALLIAALDPFLTSFTRRLLTETLAPFFCGLLLYLGVLAICKPSPLNDALVGAVASSAILVRPDMALAGGLFCVTLIVLRRSVKAAAVLVSARLPCRFSPLDYEEIRVDRAREATFQRRRSNTLELCPMVVHVG